MSHLLNLIQLQIPRLKENKTCYVKIVCYVTQTRGRIGSIRNIYLTHTKRIIAHFQFKRTPNIKVVYTC